MTINTILGVVALSVGILVFLVATHLSFHRRGFKKGYLDGYGEGFTAGRKQADNWWIGLEDQANQVREKIWREEAQL